MSELGSQSVEKTVAKHRNRTCTGGWPASARKSPAAPRRSSKASDWVKVTRAGIADAKAIVPAGDAAGSGPSEPAEAAIHGEAADPALPIRVLVGRVE